MRPDGSVDYSASGSTFLYMGAFGGIQPQQLGQSMGQYIVRGVVRDEGGQPVEGAAIDLSGEMAFTNSRGEFFVRVRRPQRYALVVSLDDFLLPGRWALVSAPSEVIAESETRARPVEIVLRRAAAPAAPAPAQAAPAASPPPQAAPATRAPATPVNPVPPAPSVSDSVWSTSDTLHRVSAAGSVPERDCVASPYRGQLRHCDLVGRDGRMIDHQRHATILDA